MYTSILENFTMIKDNFSTSVMNLLRNSIEEMYLFLYKYRYIIIL